MANAFVTPNRLPRRDVLTLASAAAGGLALSACTPDTTQPAGSGSGKKQISILDDNTNALFKKSMIAAFEEETGIEVVRYEQLNFNDLHDRLATLFAARDTSYDVVMTWAAWSAEFGQAGWLESLPVVEELPASVRVGFRPEELVLRPAGAGGTGSYPVVVQLVEPVGAATDITVAADGATFVVRSGGFRRVAVGDRFELDITEATAHVFDSATGHRMSTEPANRRRG